MAPSGTAPPGDRRVIRLGSAVSGPPAARAGNAFSFERLFRDEFDTMFRLAALLGSRDPENVVQEAFMRLHREWPSLEHQRRAGGYLRTTVVNLCRSEGRHTQVVQRIDPRLVDDGLAPSAEVEALRTVSQEALLDRMQGLAPRHREALVLRFWLDLSEIQMAEAMNCAPGTVKSHVSRALAALRHSLRENGDIR